MLNKLCNVHENMKLKIYKKYFGLYFNVPYSAFLSPIAINGWEESIAVLPAFLSQLRIAALF